MWFIRLVGRCRGLKLRASQEERRFAGRGEGREGTRKKGKVKEIIKLEE